MVLVVLVLDCGLTKDTSTLRYSGRNSGISGILVVGYGGSG